MQFRNILNLFFELTPNESYWKNYEENTALLMFSVEDISVLNSDKSIKAMLVSKGCPSLFRQ